MKTRASTDQKQDDAPGWELIALSKDGRKVLSLAVPTSDFSLTGSDSFGVGGNQFHMPTLGSETLFFQREADRLTVLKRGSAGPGFFSKSLRFAKIQELAGHDWLLMRSVPEDLQLPRGDAADGEEDARSGAQGAMNALVLRLIHWLSLPMQGKEMFESALQGFLNILLQETLAMAGAVVTFDQRGARLIAASGLKPDQTENYIKNFPQALLQQIVQEDTRLILPEALRAAAGRDWRSTTLFLKGASSIAGFPVTAEGQVQAILLINLKNIFSELTEPVQALLEGAARLLGLVFQRAILREQLHEFKMRGEDAHSGTKSGNRLMIGRSLLMDEVYQRLQKYAQVSIPVLIMGETGTGKELAAREIHRHSTRKAGPFVAFNSAALPENLVEAELFGYRKGAFTGAISDRPGLIELAAGGTLFVDEVGEMPLSLQAKLLRVLQERQVVRLGESTPRSIDFRLVSATHCALPELIDRGVFREDFYYRIAGATIKLPPLRQRAEDIPLLAHYFKTRYASLHRLPFKDFSSEALDALTRHPWQGNIRQLQHVVETSLIMADGEVITTADLALQGEASLQVKTDASIDQTSDSQTLADAKSEWLRLYLLKTLEKNEWNKSRTARSLGIGLRTLFRYIEQLGISDLITFNAADVYSETIQ